MSAATESAPDGDELGPIDFLAVEFPHARITSAGFERLLTLADGGVIGILDMLSRAYPGFLLTEDIGRIDVDEECACGRTGQMVSFVRRLEGAELGCCAVTWRLLRSKGLGRRGSGPRRPPTGRRAGSRPRCRRGS